MRLELRIPGALFLMFILPLYLFSAEVPSQIVSVTVFADRAMVTRRALISVGKGTTDITFEGLPEHLDPSSVQVRGKGAFRLSNVKVTDRYMSQVESERMKKLLREKEEYRSSLEESKDAAEEAKSEKAFIQSIASMLTRSGKDTAGELDPEKWIKMVGFYRDKLHQLDGELRSTEKTIRTIGNEIDRIDREIQSLGYQQNKAVKEITVTLASPSAGEGTLDVSYLVPGPSWAAAYTIQVDDQHGEASVIYRAVVHQSTGEDWLHTALSLSTAKPSTGARIPELRPWYLDVEKGDGPLPAPLLEAKKSVGSVSRKGPSLSEMRYPVMRVQPGLTSVVFTAAGKTTVESDNAGHTVTIAMFTVPASFTYASIPKKSPFVFLQAEITNSSGYPLLPGEGHIFLNGNFIVKTPLKYISEGEKFKINCGIDEGFTVTRKRINRFEEAKGFFTKKTIVKYTYSIALTNHRKGEKKVEVWDQLPVSKNKSIVVSLLGDAAKMNEFGYIKWTRVIKPGQTAVIPLSYSVSFPENVPVDNLE